ncbi:BPSS1780 family membrane protein [Xenorhabdus bovienii]|uniref:Transmembrane protein n=3 Tax=Xenorhabdus bovienii TaxID=40576 RepID=A0A077QIW5_XENBV|nr:BPSS1780 family membrane protein [Xenorhabdus bovienii]MDE1477481.1 DUF975 family protein [Xenorhabdus bovienii]MDE1484345.1 DUF975 family protein [Xenorhabdus bovienii]MDE1487000.1 DUF975 family protein [Xenorhabdus bovienii]MDE1491903.1 DUF975 family protein [Xenorhabdus bovienii]MDE9431463.1 DUF975 family protein [Xenorhabdus bovienii]
MNNKNIDFSSRSRNVSLTKDKETFIPNGRAAGANAAIEWVRNSWEIVKQNLGNWILLLFLYLICFTIILLVPFINLIALFIAPVFMGGFMAICEEYRKKGSFNIGLFFHGFKKNFGSLLAVGIFTILILTVGVLAAIVIGSIGIYQFYLIGQGSEIDIAMVLLIFFIFILTYIAIMFFSILGLAYTWFAPALIVINGLKFSDAISMSFNAVKKNLLGGFIFFLLMNMIITLSIIPLGLGLFITIPIYLAAYYTSYRSIFYVESKESEN